MTNKIVSRFKQYGIYNSIKRILKKVLSYLSIRIETYLYCTQNITAGKLGNVPEPDINVAVKALTYEDFEKASSMSFETKKLMLFKKRLERGDYLAYGAYYEGRLIYSCWISLSEFEMPVHGVPLKLDNESGLILDAICHPDFRNLGLHRYMSFYRLNKMWEKKKSKAVMVILKENVPSRRAHARAGYKVESEIHYLKILFFKKIIIRESDICL